MTPAAATFATAAHTSGGTALADAVVDAVIVTRWRRSGRDRAYVHVDGRIVGFRDLVTGVAECSDAEHLDTLMSVTDEFVHLRAARSAA